MQYGQSFRYRRALLLLGALLAAIIVCVFIYRSFIEARITVIAPAGTTVTIFDVDGSTKISGVRMRSNSVTLGVGTSKYLILTDNGASGKQLFYVQGSLFQNQKLALAATAELPASTLARQVAYDVIPGTNTVSYLNTSLRVIEQLDANGNTAALDSDIPIANLNTDNTGNAQGIHLVKGGQAIAVTNGLPYVLRGGQLIPLNTTGFPGLISRMIVATNPSNDSFVIAANQALFWYSSPDAAPKRLLVINKKIDQLAYGGTKVIAYSTRMPDAAENIRSAYSAYAVDPLAIDINTGEQSTLTTGPIVDASISPDGAYATIQLRRANTISLYDLQKNRWLYDAEAPNITTPAWIDNSHYVYGKRGSIWKMDVTTRSAIAISSLPKGQDPTSISFDGTNTYYATTYQDDNTAAIYRFTAGTTDQNTERAAALDTAIQTTALYNLTYTNISRPTLLITTSVQSGNPSRSAFQILTQQSRQAALDYLHTAGVDPSKLTIIYNPANP